LILQLIGLPASGKTYVLEKIKQEFNSIKILNLTSYTGYKREKALLKAVKAAAKSSTFVIVESACGLKDLNSIVVLLRVSKAQYVRNENKRKDFLTKADQFRLIDQMLPPNYTVYDVNSCETLIKTIIKTEFLYVTNSNITCKATVN